MNAKALAMMPSAAPIFAQCNNFASGEIAAPLPITIPAPATFDATINKKVDEWRWKL